jgi:fumarylacetoacetate (FAA) hydrolase family protein
MKLLLAAVFISGVIAQSKADAQSGSAWMIMKRGCDAHLGYCGYVDKTTGVGDVTSMRPQSKWSIEFPELVTYVASQFN